MESLYLLIPVAVILVGLIVMVLFWSIRQGQYDDMEGPGHSILLDDDSHEVGIQKGETGKLDPDQNQRVRQNVASNRHQSAIK